MLLVVGYAVTGRQWSCEGKVQNPRLPALHFRCVPRHLAGAAISKVGGLQTDADAASGVQHPCIATIGQATACLELG